jgi:hypothetical protein
MIGLASCASSDPDQIMFAADHIPAKRSRSAPIMIADRDHDLFGLDHERLGQTQ